jgi:hypothetical protein
LNKVFYNISYIIITIIEIVFSSKMSQGLTLASNLNRKSNETSKNHNDKSITLIYLLNHVENTELKLLSISNIDVAQLSKFLKICISFIVLFCGKNIIQRTIIMAIHRYFYAYS